MKKFRCQWCKKDCDIIYCNYFDEENQDYKVKICFDCKNKYWELKTEISYEKI